MLLCRQVQEALGWSRKPSVDCQHPHVSYVTCQGTCKGDVPLKGISLASSGNCFQPPSLFN